MDASIRSALPLLLVAILSGSLAWAGFGERGILRNRELEAERLARVEAVAARKRTIEHLRGEIIRLRADAVTQERFVREELGYVRPGEVVYLFPDEQQADFELVGDRRLKESRIARGAP